MRLSDFQLVAREGVWEVVCHEVHHCLEGHNLCKEIAMKGLELSGISRLPNSTLVHIVAQVVSYEGLTTGLLISKNRCHDKSLESTCLPICGAITA